MRSIVIALAFFSSTACWAAPIKYIFTGYTTSILVSDGEYDPNVAITRADGSIVTNGQSKITGELIFDPSAWRDGAGGEGLGEVFSWTCTTQGLTYFGAGGAFHYLEFEENSFSYLDEIPQGGYGPDVAGITFNFDNAPFADGPAHFPMEHFIGGTFSTAVEQGWISESRTMWGVQGVIDDLSLAPVPVPAPPSLMLFAGWLAMLGVWQSNRKAKPVAYVD